VGLKKFLAAGLSVPGSKYDGKVKNMKDMSEAAQKRHGYLGPDGFWTTLGQNRATTVDLKELDKSLRAMRKFQRSFW